MGLANCKKLYLRANAQDSCLSVWGTSSSGMPSKELFCRAISSFDRLVEKH